MEQEERYILLYAPDDDLLTSSYLLTRIAETASSRMSGNTPLIVEEPTVQKHHWHWCILGSIVAVVGSFGGGGGGTHSDRCPISLCRKTHTRLFSVQTTTVLQCHGMDPPRITPRASRTSRTRYSRWRERERKKDKKIETNKRMLCVQCPVESTPLSI